MIVKTALALMVLFGLWGAGRLSYDQYLSGEACPILGDMVPACYIAFAGYILIAAGVTVSLLGIGTFGGYLFWGGTAIAGGLAALASVLELIKGDVCPLAFGSVPMCYISLAFSVVIAVLFIIQAAAPETQGVNPAEN
ncbi:hypothetical protein N9L06_02715 [Mariniblastus sp.]|nr:hypothetical protein [Mariniblastus sp.]